jgi:demethylmenaquinone methyltransferase / 2-methoxy-6-polyprenyl-1,4-benzoquinol methylase
MSRTRVDAAPGNPSQWEMRLASSGSCPVLMTGSTPPHPVLDEYYASAGDRRGFVTALFDGAARHYNRVGRTLDLGSGPWYRRQALRRAGLRPGMKLLDVATGTGLLAQGAVRILGEPGRVIGVDPSAGMLREARKALSGPLVRGWAETLPFGNDRFDMLSMSFALRHVTGLEAAFEEYLRVLKPGGRLLLLELSRPDSAVTRWLIRVHLQRVLPWIMKLTTGSEPARLLMKFYWDTIDRCVPPQTIVDVLRRSGFVDVERRVFFGCLSEYVATKAAGPRAPLAVS